MIVMFDIDDCLMPWAETVHLACVEAGITDDKAYTSWHMWEDYGCTKEEWLEVVNSLVVPGGIYHQPPYDGAAEAVRELYWEGHEIHLVTARGFMDHAEEIRAWTQEWVEEFAIPGRLEFAKDKAAVAREFGFTHAVDDGLHNYEALLAEGVEVYLLNQPHNQGPAWPARVNSVRHFVDKIKGNA